MVRGSGILSDSRYKDIFVFEEKNASPSISFLCVAMTKYLREELKGSSWFRGFISGLLAACAWGDHQSGWDVA